VAYRPFSPVSLSIQGDRMGRLAGLIKGKLRAKYMKARDKL
jgi:hypothetical protein